MAPAVIETLPETIPDEVFDNLIKDAEELKRLATKGLNLQRFIARMSQAGIILGIVELALRLVRKFGVDLILRDVADEIERNPNHPGHRRRGTNCVVWDRELHKGVFWSKNLAADLIEWGDTAAEDATAVLGAYATVYEQRWADEWHELMEDIADILERNHKVSTKEGRARTVKFQRPRNATRPLKPGKHVGKSGRQ